MTSRFLLALLVLSATPALAHELARDKTVSALMHTDPDDAPLIAKPTAVFFELTRQGGGAIPLSQCACTLNIYAGKARPGDRPLTHGVLRQGQGDIRSSVVFPRAGAYTMVLMGRPRTPRVSHAFPPFSLSWTVRADTP